MMYKFIKRLLLGLLLIAILDYSFGKILEHLYFKQSTGFQYRTTYSIAQTNQEVLIFGSSRANHHYRPEILEEKLNATCYNTGREGLFIFYQTALLSSILERYTPEVIIYDFAGSLAYDQADYDKLSALLPYYDDYPKIQDIVNLRSKFEAAKNTSKVYPYNSTLLNILNGYVTPPNNESYSKGYFALENVWEKKLDSVDTPRQYDIDPNKLDQLKKFMSLAKRHNIKTYVVYSPVFYLYDTDYSIEIARSLCQEMGIKFLDFSKNQDFLSKRTLFSDPIHLNGEGASLFSKIVADTILADLNDY